MRDVYHTVPVNIITVILRTDFKRKNLKYFKHGKKNFSSHAYQRILFKEIIIFVV